MLRALSALVVLAALCGCSTLPTTGEVHTRSVGSDNSPAPYFAPPGPTPGDSQEAVVRGFLLAMQANPPSTSVARSFLSNRAKGTWSPGEATVVYDTATVESAGGQVVARLRGAHRLTPHGAWLGGTDATTDTLPITLVQEDGEWRISNPPNALAVPSSYFSSIFVPFYLYFFDHTGTVLVPTRVFVPPGEETATNLVRGLLAGPPPAQSDTVTSSLPAGLDLDPVVVVNDAGIAEVPVTDALLALKPAELDRVVAQLAWTLRQVPGITRLRISVDGAPVPLADGRTDISVNTGQEYDPGAAAQRELLVVSGGRVLQDDGSRVAPVAGPFGQPGFALQSLAWSTRNHTIAAVSGNGRRVFVAPDRGSRSETRVRTVLDGGTKVLRPTYDRFGDLWLVDATRSGAVVHVVRGRRDRIVRVPGITGRRVSAFTLTRDGTALVAVLARGSTPTVEVSGLVRDETGRLRRVQPARSLQVTGADPGAARDVVQVGVSSVAVLARPASGADQVLVIQLDGSPDVETPQGPTAPETVPGPLATLVGSPDTALPLRVVGVDRRLYTRSEEDRWLRTALTGVVAATYAG